MASLIQQPRVRLASLPTPLQPCPRLREAMIDRLGLDAATVPRVYLKRDDLTGLALGGNKTRKLEYLIADARRAGATHVITEGGWQSNHFRQTAAAARAVGLGCTLVVNYPAQRYPDHPEPPVQGNLLLDRLLGAEVRFVSTGKDRKAGMEAAAEALREAGQTPYLIPTGGSNGIGAMGYVNASLELAGQYDALGVAPRATYSAWGSGGTFAGLIVGHAMLGLPGELVSVLVVPAQRGEEAVEDAWPIVTELVDTLGVPGGVVDAYRERLVGDAMQIGAGYGVATPACLEAIRLLIDTEAVLLDPVYSAKAFAGMVAHIRAGRYSAKDVVVFLHTGGQAVLFDPLHAVEG